MTHVICGTKKENFLPDVTKRVSYCSSNGESGSGVPDTDWLIYKKVTLRCLLPTFEFRKHESSVRIVVLV